MEQRYSQALAAENLGITRDQLANIEAARVPLKFWTGWKACCFFQANPRWLATGAGPKSPWVEEYSLAQLLRGKVSERTPFSEAMKLVLNSCLGPADQAQISADSAATLFENPDRAAEFYASFGALRPALEASGLVGPVGDPTQHPLAQRISPPQFKKPFGANHVLEELNRRLEGVLQHVPENRRPAFYFHIENAIDRFLREPFMPDIRVRPPTRDEAAELARRYADQLRALLGEQEPTEAASRSSTDEGPKRQAPDR